MTRLSNLRFRAYGIIIPFSFSLLFHFSFRVAFPSTFLASGPLCCPHRFRLLAAASLSFNFRVCMRAERERSLCRPSSGLSPSVGRALLLAATPVVVSILAV